MSTRKLAIKCELIKRRKTPTSLYQIYKEMGALTKDHAPHSFFYNENRSSAILKQHEITFEAIYIYAYTYVLYVCSTWVFNAFCFVYFIFHNKNRIAIVITRKIYAPTQAFTCEDKRTIIGEHNSYMRNCVLCIL